MHKIIEAYLTNPQTDYRRISVETQTSNFLKNCKDTKFKPDTPAQASQLEAQARMICRFAQVDDDDTLCKHLLKWDIEKTLLLADASPDVDIFLTKPAFDHLFWGKLLIKKNSDVYNKVSLVGPHVYREAYLSEMRRDYLKMLQEFSKKFITKLLAYETFISIFLEPKVSFHLDTNAFITKDDFKRTLSSFREFLKKDFADKYGNSPLQMLISAGLEHEAIVLIEAGADIHRLNKAVATDNPLRLSASKSAVSTPHPLATRAAL